MHTMSSGSKQRNKQQRIDNLGIEKSRFSSWWQDSDKTDVTIRIAMATAAAVLLLLFCLSWRPPFAYREGAVPSRNLVSRVSFDLPDPAATEQLQEQRRREIEAFYRNRTGPLDQLRARLRDQLFLVLSAPTYDQLSAAARRALEQFQLPADADEILSPTEKFELLRLVQAQDEEFKTLDDAVKIAMADLYQNGILQALQHEPKQGNQTIIRVYPETVPENVRYLELEKVRIAKAGSKVAQLMRDRFRDRFKDAVPQYRTAAELISGFLIAKLPEFQTLSFDCAANCRSRRGGHRND